MTDYANSLATLQPDDLKFLLPTASASISLSRRTTINPGISKEDSRKRRRSRRNGASAGNQVPAVDEGAASAERADPPADLSTQPHPLPAYQPDQENAANVARPIPVVIITPPTVTPSAPATTTAKSGSTEPDTTDKPARHRRTLEHTWPPEGAILTANYFGTTYRAQIVLARKALKSGKQIRLLDGPLNGKRFDSLTAAMIAVTARQRKQMNLGRKGTSNGWTFWCYEHPDGKTIPLTAMSEAG